MSMRGLCACGAVDLYELTDDSSIACSSCGVIDIAQSSVSGFRETFRGYDIGESFTAYGNSLDKAQRDRASAERLFKARMEGTAVSWLFYQPNILGLPTKHNPLGIAETTNPFIRLVMTIYYQIRYKYTLDLDPHDKQPQKETTNYDTKRVRNHLALAIRFAAMQNNLLLAYQVLGEEGQDTFPRVLKGLRPVIGVVLPVPFLRNMMENLRPSNPDLENPIGDSKYLHRANNHLVRLLDRPTDPLYTMLSHAHLVIQRLRQMVDADEDTLQTLICFDQKSSPLYRQWSSADFDYFRDEVPANGGWDKAILMAYHLYRAQQCLMLWTNSTTYVIAVGLALTATIGVVGSLYPYTTALVAELCAQYGATHYYTCQTMASLRRMIVGWSSSLNEIGVELPFLNLPRRGLVGEGVSGWNGDARRRVPELEIWVVAIEAVAMNWKAIRLHRLQTRIDAMPYYKELLVARTMFAQATPDCRRKTRVKNGDSKRAQLLRVYAEEAEVAEVAAGVPSSPVPESPEGDDNWELDPDPEFMFDFAADGAPNPDWYPTIIPLEDAASSNPPLPSDVKERYINLEELQARTAKDVLDDMMKEDSSDEEDAWSSDDEVRPRGGLELRGMGAGRTNMAFSIGPGGFFQSQEMDEEEMGNNYTREEYSPASRRSDLSDSGSMTGRRSAGVRRHNRFDRFASPAISVSTLHSLASTNPRSIAMSRGSSASVDTLDGDLLFPSVLGKRKNFTPKASRPIAELDPAKNHIASLIRERDEYRPYSAAEERVTGRLVSKDIEEYLTAWLGKLREKGAMPTKITSAYLASIGLRGKNPMVDDLSTWIRAQQWRWSPLECILRAGIPPTQIPSWMVPHSKLAVMRALEHHRELLAFDAELEFPEIPKRYKSEPERYRKEINDITTARELDVSDGFPVFFPTREMFPLGAEADALFTKGELEMYIAEDEEVEEREQDKDFMDILHDRDEDGVPREDRDTDVKRQKRQKAVERRNAEKVSTEFRGYERALQGDDDFWHKAAFLAEVEDGDKLRCEDDYWGNEEEMAAAAAAADEAWGEEVAMNGKRKADEGAGAEAKKRKKETLNVESPRERAASESSSTPTVRPTVLPPATTSLITPSSVIAQPATLNEAVAMSAPSAIPSPNLTPTAPVRRPLEVASLLNPAVSQSATPSPTPHLTPLAKRAQIPVPPSVNLPPPPKITQVRKAKSATAVNRHPKASKPPATIKDVEARMVLNNEREFKRIQIFYLKTLMKDIYMRAGATETAANRGGEGIPLDSESQKRMNDLKVERNKLEVEVAAARRLTVGLVADNVWVKATVKTWAMGQNIPLRLVGWGKKGTILE